MSLLCHSESYKHRYPTAVSCDNVMAGTGARHLEIGRSGSIGQVLKALKRVGRGSSQAMFEPEWGVLTVGLERWRLGVWGWAGLGDCCWCAGLGVCC